MNLFNITYFLNSKPLGATKLSVPYEINKPHSLAFFCATCGKLWASTLVHENPSCWQLYNRPCERHTPQMACEDHSQPPGSLAAYLADAAHVGSGSWAGTFDAMPPEVRLREAKLRGLDTATEEKQ